MGEGGRPGREFGYPGAAALPTVRTMPPPAPRATNTPPLVGVTFCQQMVPVEVDPSLNVLAITATNALSLTAGIF